MHNPTKQSSIWLWRLAAILCCPRMQPWPLLDEAVLPAAATTRLVVHPEPVNYQLRLPITWNLLAVHCTCLRTMRPPPTAPPDICSLLPTKMAPCW